MGLDRPVDDVLIELAQEERVKGGVEARDPPELLVDIKDGGRRAT
jgi:hypothetical protein